MTLISKTLIGTYEGGHKHVFEKCCYKKLDIVIYIYIYTVANYKYYISVKTLKTLKNYTEMLRLVSDLFTMLMLCS